MHFAQRVKARRTQTTRSGVQPIHYYKINKAMCGPALFLFLLTVIPCGGETSDVTCIADLSSIENMRTYKYNETNENRYLPSSVTLSPRFIPSLHHRIPIRPYTYPFNEIYSHL